MDNSAEKEGLEYLKEIEEEVSEIADSAPSPRKAFFYGVLQGMGAVVGSLLAVMLLGWTLSVLGLIPGLKEVGSYIQDISTKTK